MTTNTKTYTEIGRAPLLAHELVPNVLLLLTFLFENNYLIIIQILLIDCEITSYERNKDF